MSVCFFALILYFNVDRSVLVIGDGISFKGELFRRFQICCDGWVLHLFFGDDLFRKSCIVFQQMCQHACLQLCALNASGVGIFNVEGRRVSAAAKRTAKKATEEKTEEKPEEKPVKKTAAKKTAKKTETK